MKYSGPNDLDLRCPCEKCKEARVEDGIKPRLFSIFSDIPDQVKGAGRLVDPFPELIITSGRRCKEHNRDVGGALMSQHLEGNAIDIGILNYSLPPSVLAYEIVDAAMVLGVKFIEVTPRHVHLDIRSDHQFRLIIRP